MFSFLYGFLLLIGINQILLTPCVLFHLPFKFVFYLIVSINIVLVVISLFIKPKYKKIRIKKDFVITAIMCILIISQIVCTTIIYKENADDSYYIGLSTSNIDVDKVYKYEPSMGYKSEETLLTPTEQMPTYELQISVYSKLFDINPTIMCHTVLPMIIIFISYLAYYHLGQNFFNKKYAKIFLIILSIVFIFTGFSTKYRASCLLLKAWQGKALFLNVGVTIITSYLIKMSRKTAKSSMIMLIISNMFSLSLTSTAMFLIPFMYLAFGILKLIKLKWKSILYYIISFIPIIVYGLIFIILTKTSSVGMYFIPTDEVDIMQGLRYYNSKVYLIYYLISTILIMFIGTKKAKKYFVYVQLINLLTIWNPLLSDFIAKYFTSSAVFWRVIWLLPIEITIAYAIVKILKNIRNKKIKAIVLVVSIAMLIIPGDCIYSFKVAENLENIPQYIINHTNYILEHSEEEDILVMSAQDSLHSVSIRQLTSKIRLVQSRSLYIGKIEDEEEIVERNNLAKIYLHQFVYTIEEFNKLMEKYDIDWIIVDKNDINVINYINKTNMKNDCEMDGFILYKAD